VQLWKSRYAHNIFQLFVSYADQFHTIWLCVWGSCRVSDARLGSAKSARHLSHHTHMLHVSPCVRSSPSACARPNRRTFGWSDPTKVCWLANYRTLRTASLRILSRQLDSLGSCPIWNITLDKSICWNLGELMHCRRSDEANDLLLMWMFSEIGTDIQNRDNEVDAWVYHLWQLHFTKLLLKYFSLRVLFHYRALITEFSPISIRIVESFCLLGDWGIRSKDTCSPMSVAGSAGRQWGEWWRSNIFTNWRNRHVSIYCGLSFP
jgi:hypothetical protein